MNEDEIVLLITMMRKQTILWLATCGEYLELSHVRNAPAYEGDPDPEPSAFFKDRSKGWIALSNCDIGDFYQISPALIKN